MTFEKVIGGVLPFDSPPKNGAWFPNPTDTHHPSIVEVTCLQLSTASKDTSCILAEIWPKRPPGSLGNKEVVGLLVGCCCLLFLVSCLLVGCWLLALVCCLLVAACSQPISCLDWANITQAVPRFLSTFRFLPPRCPRWSTQCSALTLTWMDFRGKSLVKLVGQDFTVCATPMLL